MAETLPDIETATVGPIAYWNALDHGASSLDPGDILTYSGVTSFETYDNGVTGTLSRHPGLKFRAKTDGWIVVYNDLADAEMQHFNLLPSGINQTSLNQLTLTQEINALRQKASTSGDMNFNHSDVALYDYSLDGASRFRLMQFSSNSFNSNMMGYGFDSADNAPVLVIQKGTSGRGFSIGFDGESGNVNEIQDITSEVQTPGVMYSWSYSRQIKGYGNGSIAVLVAEP